jgi:predicted nucleotidyltransferase
MAWVKAHVSELMAIAERLGAGHISLCGSVARDTDTESSDIDFYVWEFDEGASGTIEHSEARRRARNLVNEFRAMSPYNVDVLGIPGWLLGPSHEASMQRDSIDLSSLAE